MDKENVAYMCHGMLFGHKTEGNFAISDNRKGPEGIILNEKTNTLTCMWNIISSP